MKISNSRRVNFSKYINIFSEIISGMKLKICIHASDISRYINCFFYSSQIRTLVSMATYISHRLTRAVPEVRGLYS